MNTCILWEHNPSAPFAKIQTFQCNSVILLSQNNEGFPVNDTQNRTVNSSSEHTDISCLLGRFLQPSHWPGGDTLTHTSKHSSVISSVFWGAAGRGWVGIYPDQWGVQKRKCEWTEPHGIAGHTLMEISRELTFRLTHTHTTEEDALSCVFSQAVKELSRVRKMKLYCIKGLGLYSTQVLFLSLYC